MIEIWIERIIAEEIDMARFCRWCKEEIELARLHGDETESLETELMQVGIWKLRLYDQLLEFFFGPNVE